MIRFYINVCLIFFVSILSLHSAERPNILFIAVDDLNDWVGPLQGHPSVKTPHIDRLAARGTTFLNAHCQAPLCNPSRTSLLLSLRPTTTGIYCLEPFFFQLPQWQERVSLFEHFKSHGYATYSVGKIWHGGVGPKQSLRHFTEVGQTGKLVRPAKPFADTPSHHPLVDWGAYPEKDEAHYDYQTADWAIAKMKAKPQEPFCLAVGFSLPHVPCYAPQKWFDLYPEDAPLLPIVPKQDRDDVPRFAWYLHWQLPEPRLKYLVENKQWLPLVRAYLASVSFMDAQVGRLLQSLEENGLADNTIVVLWGDHGWHLGEKDITGKNTLWERSTRVPLIFAGPGVPKNATRTSPAELLDVYPTLSDLCGLPARRDLEGHSLVPQLQSEPAKREHPAITSHGPGNHTVRTERWRYIRYADQAEELYDMQADPHEWSNLASRAEHAALKQELSAWMPKYASPPAPGSKSRLIELQDDGVYWETKKIEKDGAIPD